MKKNVVDIGIDLGTTYSSVSYYDSSTKDVIMLENNRNSKSTPSWVTLSQKINGLSCIVVGQIAKDDERTECVGYDSKRLIGKSIKEIKRMSDETEKWPFEVVEKYGIPAIQIFNCGFEDEEVFVAEEISGFILEEMLNIVKNRVNSPIGKVVVTVPADFNDSQRHATLRACKLIGLKDYELLNEPSATIIEYQRLFGIKNGSKVVIIDFGGGTLDVCCCLVYDNRIEVKGTGGNQNLGGNDFDRAIIDIIINKLNENEIIPQGYYQKTGRDTPPMRKYKTKRIIKIRREAERIKIHLSSHESCKVDLDSLFSSQDTDKDGFKRISDAIQNAEISISGIEFYNECKELGLIKKFKKTVLDVMVNGKFNKASVNLVIPVGGSCSIPFVRNIIRGMFDGALMAEDTFDTLNAVCKGAAIQASKLSCSIEKYELYDTIPYPIGFEVNGFTMDTFVENGCHIPYESFKRYYPSQDNQTEVTYKLFRGYSKITSSNELVDKMTIFGIPPNTKKEDFPMRVKCSINTNGIVEINVYKEGYVNLLGQLRVEMDLSKIEEHFNDILAHFKQFLR